MTHSQAGGIPNGAPGERPYVKGYYAAYVLDPLGNNIEVVCFNPLWLRAMKTAMMLSPLITLVLGMFIGGSRLGTWV